MLIAPGMVSFSKLAAGRTSMIKTVLPLSSCFLSSLASFGVAPIAHLVCGSTGYLRCSWAKQNMPRSKMALVVKLATKDFMSPPFSNHRLENLSFTGREVTLHSCVTSMGIDVTGRKRESDIPYLVFFFLQLEILSNLPRP